MLCPWTHRPGVRRTGSPLRGNLHTQRSFIEEFEFYNKHIHMLTESGAFCIQSTMDVRSGALARNR